MGPARSSAIFIFQLSAVYHHGAISYQTGWIDVMVLLPKSPLGLLERDIGVTFEHVLDNVHFYVDD